MPLLLKVISCLFLCLFVKYSKLNKFINFILEAKGSKANPGKSPQPNVKHHTNGHNANNQMDMPIYSQVQKPTSTNNNRNLIITNGGTTNADSWV